MRIEVTAEDIAKGERLRACRCPVALALSRAGFEEPEVYPSYGPDDYSPGGAGEIIAGGDRFALPLTVDRFVAAFDEGKPVEPFAFDLDATP